MSNNSTEFLDDKGCFKFGRHQAHTIEYVARNDPGYLKWIIDKTDCCDEDVQIIEASLHLAR